jgi:TetR/AcrR family fatty acid metabolism transcriptional regulator
MQAAHDHRTLKEKQRQEREQLILKTAEEVFIANGYFDTSIDEIASRVGIGKGTVYLHFTSKEDLVVAILTRDMQTFLQAVDDAVSAPPSLAASEKLKAMLHFMYSGFYSKRARLLSSIYHSPDLQRFFMQKKESMRELWEQLATRIRAVLEEGKVAGEFDSNIPTSVMLNAFFCLQSPRTYEALVVGEQMSPDELVKHLGEIYFKGIAVVK